MLKPLECWTSYAHDLLYGGLLPRVIVSKDNVLGVICSKIDDIEGRIVSVTICTIYIRVLKVSY